MSREELISASCRDGGEARGLQKVVQACRGVGQGQWASGEGAGVASLSHISFPTSSWWVGSGHSRSCCQRRNPWHLPGRKRSLVLHRITFDTIPVSLAIGRFLNLEWYFQYWFGRIYLGRTSKIHPEKKYISKQKLVLLDFLNAYFKSEIISTVQSWRPNRSKTSRIESPDMGLFFPYLLSEEWVLPLRTSSGRSCFALGSKARGYPIPCYFWAKAGVRGAPAKSHLAPPLATGSPSLRSHHTVFSCLAIFFFFFKC